MIRQPVLRTTLRMLQVRSLHKSSPARGYRPHILSGRFVILMRCHLGGRTVVLEVLSCDFVVILSAGRDGVGQFAVEHISEPLVFFWDPLIPLFLGMFCIPSVIDFVAGERKDLKPFPLARRVKAADPTT